MKDPFAVDVGEENDWELPDIPSSGSIDVWARFWGDFQQSKIRVVLTQIRRAHYRWGRLSNCI